MGALIALKQIGQAVKRAGKSYADSMQKSQENRNKSSGEGEEGGKSGGGGVTGARKVGTIPGKIKKIVGGGKGNGNGNGKKPVKGGPLKSLDI